jgi:hypothetical protein
MTVVLRDSIQTKPLPIANAIIHTLLTREVTAFWKGENPRILVNQYRFRNVLVSRRHFYVCHAARRKSKAVQIAHHHRCQPLRPKTS